jgi:uncharacterized membrane protein
MNKRPSSITIISWIFIAAGILALFYHLGELRAEHFLENGLVWVCFVRFLAILGGVFMLRGFNWARWLLAAWIAYHVILSAFHSPFELAVHGLLFAVVAYFLFRSQASAYFQAARTEPPQMPKKDDNPAA